MIMFSRNVDAGFGSLFCVVLPFSIPAVEQNPEIKIGMQASVKNGKRVF